MLLVLVLANGGIGLDGALENLDGGLVAIALEHVKQVCIVIVDSKSQINKVFDHVFLGKDGVH